MAAAVRRCGRAVSVCLPLPASHTPTDRRPPCPLAHTVDLRRQRAAPVGRDGRCGATGRRRWRA
eukprot:3816654-Prymnesium_polylepis.1